MKEDLIRKFVEKLDYSYNYKTVNERQSIINDLCEIAGIEQLTIPIVNKSLPDWYKELSLLELQMQALKYDIPRNLIEKQGYVTDLETFDMKLTAMQNRLHRAFEELKGNVV